MQARGEILKNADDLWVEGQIDWENVPARIEGLIAEQVNRLPAHLGEVLEAASVQGETFMAEVIAQVLGMDERQVLHYLTTDLGKNHRLVVEKGVQRIGTQRLSQFRFRHVLFQSYLYHSLGAVERPYLHERVATVLEALCHGDVEPFAEQLAHHFQEADMSEKAADYLLRTGKRALRMAAHEESMKDLRTGLALLEHVPPSAGRDRTELEMLVTLGTSLIATKGFAAAEVGEVYSQALQLCTQTDDASVTRSHPLQPLDIPRHPRQLCSGSRFCRTAHGTGRKSPGHGASAPSPPCAVDDVSIRRRFLYGTCTRRTRDRTVHCGATSSSDLSVWRA